MFSWLTSFQNEPLEFVHIGEINKRATTVVDGRSTLDIAKQFRVVVPLAMATQVIKDPDIRLSLWPPIKDLRDAGSCALAHCQA